MNFDSNLFSDDDFHSETRKNTTQLHQDSVKDLETSNQKRLNIFAVDDNKTINTKKSVSEKNSRKLNEIMAKNLLQQTCIDVLNDKIRKYQHRVKKLKKSLDIKNELYKEKDRSIRLLRRSLLCFLKISTSKVLSKLNSVKDCNTRNGNERKYNELKLVDMRLIRQNIKEEDPVFVDNVVVKADLQNVDKNHEVETDNFKDFEEKCSISEHVESEHIDNHSQQINIEDLSYYFDLKELLELFSKASFRDLNSTTIESFAFNFNKFISWLEPSPISISINTTTIDNLIKILIYNPKIETFNLKHVNLLTSISPNNEISIFVMKSLTIICALNFKNSFINIPQLIKIVRHALSDNYLQNKFEQILQLILKKSFTDISDQDLATIVYDNDIKAKNFSLVHTIFNYLFSYLEYRLIPTDKPIPISKRKLEGFRKTSEIISYVKYQFYMMDDDCDVLYYLNLTDLLTAFQLVFDFGPTKAFCHKYAITLKNVLVNQKFEGSVQQMLCVKLISNLKID